MPEITDDIEDIPDEYPVDDWTPKQVENWEDSGKHVYERIETEDARAWYRRVWRPKKRNDGMMERDRVSFGTPEDYIKYYVEDAFDPWGSVEGSMMRHFAVSNTDELDEHAREILKAKLKLLKKQDPEAAKRLLRETNDVANLYGLES